MVTKVDPLIESSWKMVLADEFNKEYFLELKSFLLEEKKTYRVFPPGKLIFNAFDHTPFDRVKVVLLGQDPSRLRSMLMAGAVSTLTIRFEAIISPVSSSIITALMLLPLIL